MDKVEIGEDQVVAMDAIAPGLSGLKITFVNVFGVTHPDGSWTLIDAALPLSASRIKSWAEKSFGRAPNAIVLTHGHFDHVSAAKDLADEWGVPIYAHPLEFPYLTGQQEYPAPDWKAGGGMMPFMSPTLPRGPIDLGSRLRALPGEGSELSLAELPGWTLLHTPGHTPGHVSFYRKSDGTLLVGMRFARPSRKAFLLQISCNRLSCTGRRAISPRTGRQRRSRYASWLPCSRRPSRLVMESRWPGQKWRGL